jgi:hypothetical protein
MSEVHADGALCTCHFFLPLGLLHILSTNGTTSLQTAVAPLQGQKKLQRQFRLSIKEWHGETVKLPTGYWSSGERYLQTRLLVAS